MRRIYGVLCATPEEVAAVRARLGLSGSPVRHGPTQVWTGAHGGVEVALAQCGIGKVNAAAAATLLLATHGVQALIFSGVAGGLDPALEVGTVLLADAIAIHDYGIVSGAAFTPVAYGAIPIGAPRLSRPVAVDAPVAEAFDRLIDRLQGRIDHPVVRGAVVTADYFLNCGETRERLHGEFAAQAIDMESGAVAEVARAWGVPVYVIRTLSDLAGAESHLTYPQMVEMAAANSAACVPELLAILAERTR